VCTVLARTVGEVSATPPPPGTHREEDHPVPCPHQRSARAHLLQGVLLGDVRHRPRRQHLDVHLQSFAAAREAGRPADWFDAAEYDVFATFGDGWTEADLEEDWSNADERERR